MFLAADTDPANAGSDWTKPAKVAAGAAMLVAVLADAQALAKEAAVDVLADLAKVACTADLDLAIVVRVVVRVAGHQENQPP